MLEHIAELLSCCHLHAKAGGSGVLQRHAAPWTLAERYYAIGFRPSSAHVQVCTVKGMASGGYEALYCIFGAS